MKLEFKIVKVRSGRGGYLYTILLKGESLTELEKFLTNPDNKRCTDYKPIIRRLELMVERYGFRENFFRPESKYQDDVFAFHYNENLRLYCCLYPKVLLIAGSGGVKTTRTYQEDPELNRIVKMMSEVSERIAERIRDNELRINKTGKLIGDLIFYEEN